MRILVSLALLTVLPAAAAPAATTTRQLLEEYFVIHKSLAADSTSGVAGAARKIANISTRAALSEPKRKAELTALSTAAARLQAADLKEARNQFGEVSKWMTAYLKATGDPMNPPHQFYCSMANKGWYQPDKSTRNPYYGRSMLTCGELLPYPDALQGPAGVTSRSPREKR